MKTVVVTTVRLLKHPHDYFHSYQFPMCFEMQPFPSQFSGIIGGILQSCDGIAEYNSYPRDVWMAPHFSQITLLKSRLISFKEQQLPMIHKHFEFSLCGSLKSCMPSDAEGVKYKITYNPFSIDMGSNTMESTLVKFYLV